MRIKSVVLRLCLLLCVASSAHALQVEQQADLSAGASAAVEGAPVAEEEAYQGGGVTLSQAVAQVRRQYKGQIVSAETRVSGNRETHIIKVLTQDGKVKTVRVAGRNRS